MNNLYIKKIEKKKGLYLVEIGDKELSLSQTFFLEELLYVNKGISSNDLIRLSHLSRLSPPYEYAHKLLSRGLYSSHAVREKIKIKFPDFDDINEIIFRLKKEGLLDDHSYAEAYKEAKEAELYGKKRILDDLRFKKGINPSILENLRFEDEDILLKNLFPILNRRYMDIPYQRKVIKLEKLFLDKGFSKEKAKEYALKAEVNAKEQKKRLQLDYDKARRNYSRKYEGYELKQRIIRSLLNKGYTMNDIEEVI